MDTRCCAFFLLIFVVSVSTEAEEGFDKETGISSIDYYSFLEFDRCDVLFECYMHPQCSRTLDEECFQKFENLLSGKLFLYSLKF